MNASRVIAAITVFLAFTFSLSLGAASAADIKAKRFSPYSDVWGRELPLLEGSTGRLTLSGPYIDKDGRVLIGYRDNLISGVRRYIDRLYDFFAGKVIGEWIEGGPSTLPGYTDDFDYLEKLGFKSLKNIIPVFKKSRPLPDGGRLDISVGGWVKYLRHGLRKTNSNGRNVFDWMIIHISERPRHIIGPKASDYYTNEKDDFVRTVGLFPRVFPLPDGTFLLTGLGHPLILRYRGNLDSPYIADSTNVLLMDPKRAMKMHEQSYEEAGDRLRKMFKRQPKLPRLWPEFTDIIFTAKIQLLIDQMRNRK